MTETILNQGYGYGFVVGLGAGFAMIMILLTYVLSRYMGEVQNSEHFTTASRSVKTGLISSAVVSSWTWPGTLLTSSVFAYKYGVMGCFFYGVNGCTHVIFFTMIAIQLKRKCPGAHTIVEVVKARYGAAGHIMYMIYALATNLLVSSMLLLGGAQAISVLTGMHVVAVSFLLPLSVAVYTMLGGLKATFLSDWTHTVIIYVVIIVAMFVTFATSSKIGSPDKMYDLLEEVSKTFPSQGRNGSYLTFDNASGMFQWWNVMISSFATVFGDPSYGQKAIAAAPLSSMVGYLVGGIAWQIIPWALGTCGALTALALTLDPVSPTYPHLISATETSKGMPLLYGLTCIMGKSGAAGGLLIVFMAATSSLSAEMIAFSSILTYDFYEPYVRPGAHGRNLVRASHFFTCISALIMGGLAVMFNYIGITITWILEFLGIILGPTVLTITLVLFWKKASKKAMLISMPAASVTGAACWVGACAHFNNNVINKTTLNETKTLFIGNFVGLFSAGIYMVILSFIWPENFDFSTMNNHFKVGDDATVEEEKASEDESADTERQLKFASKFSVVFCLVYIAIFAFLLPLPMYGQHYIFSKTFFRAWIVIMFIWLWIAFLYITFYPLYESRDAIYHLYNRIMNRESPQTVDFVDGTEIKNGHRIDLVSPTPSSEESVNANGDKIIHATTSISEKV